MARRFAAEGFRPVLIARDPAAIDAPGPRRGSGRCGVTADAADETSLRAAFAQVRAQMGDPAVLVFNPSLGIPGLPSEVLAGRRGARARAWVRSPP